MQWKKICNNICLNYSLDNLQQHMEVHLVRKEELQQTDSYAQCFIVHVNCVHKCSLTCGEHEFKRQEQKEALLREQN